MPNEGAAEPGDLCTAIPEVPVAAEAGTVRRARVGGASEGKFCCPSDLCALRMPHAARRDPGLQAARQTVLREVASSSPDRQALTAAVDTLIGGQVLFQESLLGGEGACA